MKKIWRFISFASLALVIVLAIQVNWILDMAEAKEDMFNEKANIVLSRTAEALSLDTVACNNLRIFGAKYEKQKIDSLFNRYMKIYDFHIDYYFELNPGPPTQNNIFPFQKQSYQACVDDKPGKKGIELKLIFPEKEKYILEEMSVLFICSVILIFLVIGVLWFTTLSLVREKKISEQTKDLLNNMTHEFKTPLTNIALANKMISKEPENKIKIKHYSDIIFQENEKLKQQIELALSIAAFEKNEMPLNLNQQNIHQLLTEILLRFKVQTDSKQIQVQQKFEAKNYFVNADKLHLHLAIGNLIDNAIKYSNENAELIIKTYNKNQFIVIEIIDKAIGIEEIYHKKIFDKFFRVPTGNVHDVKGFGLGLAYTKQIIELHQGTISVESEKEKGSTFIVTLPYAEGAI